MIGFLAYGLVIIIVWLTNEIDSALQRDRGWSSLTGFCMGAGIVFPTLWLLELGPDGWGFWRKIFGIVLCIILLSMASTIHERDTGKPLIRLPKKENSNAER